MIGDLLAQISGEPDSHSSKPALPPKRKANDDLSAGATTKAPRTTAAPLDGRSTGYTGTAAPRTATRDSRPNPTSSNRPSAFSGTSRPSSTTNSPASSAAAAARRPGTTLPARPSPSAGTLNRNGHTGSRVNGNGAGGTASASAAAAGSSKGVPKKGSYLEVMERAKAAQASMGQMGKIQHKATEKAPQRVRMMTKVEETSRTGITKKGSGLPPLGNKIKAAPGMAAQRPLPGSDGKDARNGRHGSAPGKPASFGGTANARRKQAAATKEEEKRPKKAATATTGYQGTARPRPTSSSSAAAPAGGLDRRGSGMGGSLGADAGGRSSGTGSSLRNRSAPRIPFGNPRRSRYDDDDDEMDDFIEYDDDEEEAGLPDRRGPPSRYSRYDDEEEEEDESDMEADMSDIDAEERRAEMQARREDAEQEALERRLKAEKEERKRRLMGSSSRR